MVVVIIGFIVLVLAGIGGGYFFFRPSPSAASASTSAKGGPGQGRGKGEVVLPTTEQGLPFHGIQHGAISLRGEGATVLIELDGFDFATAADSQLNYLNRVLSDALKAASKAAGKAMAGITIQPVMWQSQFDLAPLVSARRQAALAAKQSGLDGLAAFDLNEEQYLVGLAEGEPFAHRRHFIAIGFDRKAYLKEREEMAQAATHPRDAHLELRRDASLSSTGGAVPKGAGSAATSSTRRPGVGGGTPSSGPARDSDEALRQLRRQKSRLHKWWDILRENLEEQWAGGNKDQREAFSALSSGIQQHPVPATLIATLRQKAEIYLGALRSLGLAGRLLDSQQTAEVLAAMMGMPLTNQAGLLAALDEEIARLTQGVGGATPATSLGPPGKIEAVETVEDRPLLMPLGGHRHGLVDGNQFAYVPIEFNSRYIRVGLPQAVARKLLEYQEVLARAGKSEGATGQEGLTTAQGHFYKFPRPRFIKTLYSAGWPSQTTVGNLYALAQRSAISLVVTTQIRSVSRNQARNKLERQLITQHVTHQNDGSTKDLYERQRLVDSIEDLQSRLASEDETIFMVGLRVAVMADSPERLEQHARAVTSALAGSGLTVTPAHYNQAYAFYSALPFGRDFIGTAPLFGRRTLRNMTSETAACFFPCLVTDNATRGGQLIGRDKNGGLAMIDDSHLPNPHRITTGTSGAGKTVGAQVEVIRFMSDNPNGVVAYIDPQGVIGKMAEEMMGPGSVFDMSAEARSKVRLNFLDRFVERGRPRPLTDVIMVFSTFLSLLQKQSFSTNERTAITNSIKRLVEHFEQGVRLTDYIVKGFRQRYYEALDFSVAGQTELIEETLDDIYATLCHQHAIPPQGYVVRVLRDEKGKPLVLAGTLEGRERLRQSRGRDTSGVGVVLEVLNTQVGRFGRNYYSGAGASLLQIPWSDYARMEAQVKRNKPERTEQGAWLSLMLVEYLTTPRGKRRAIPVEGADAVNPASPLGDYLALLDESKLPTDPHLWEWVTPAEAKATPQAQADQAELEQGAAVAGSHLSALAGPVWYEEEGWAAQIASDFAQAFEECGLFDTLNHDQALLALRDALVGLKQGVPILSDLLAVLASEPYGRDLVENLGPYVDPGLSGALFNGHTNQDLHQRLIVFDVKNVTDELRALRMFQAMELTWRRIVSTPPELKQKFLFVIDEFGVIALKSPEMATYVGELYKRARAFGCTMWLIDQDTSVFSSLAGTHALSISGMIKVMRQSSRDAHFWRDFFELTPEETDAITTFGKGEVFIFLQEEGRVKKVQAKYTMPESTLAVLSTKLEDVREYRQAQRQSRGILDDPLDTLMETVLGHNSVE